MRFAHEDKMNLRCNAKRFFNITPKGHKSTLIEGDFHFQNNFKENLKNMIHQKQIEVNTLRRSIIDISSKITKFVVDSTISAGLCNVFIQHTSASLIICENADPAVQLDLESFLSNMVPDGDPKFTHNMEGPDDMPAHIRTILTDNSITIPIHSGKLALGTWQGVFLWEHRTSAHRRSVIMTIWS